LRDVLNTCGIRPDAVYVGYYGADRHLNGDPNRVVISRGVPLAKALQEETLLAWAMNGEPLPPLHGAPLRLVCGGWPGSASGKWLSRIVVRDRVHDGPKMGGQSYRVPWFPVAPGEKVADDEMCIIESMPVKSLVTRPASGIVVQAVATPLVVRGHAWAGELRVARVDVSIDFGQTWAACQLAEPKNRLAWQQWNTKLRLPEPGYYEVWARATDELGRSQPMVVPGWNPRGYLNNACHRVAVRAAWQDGALAALHSGSRPARHVAADSVGWKGRPGGREDRTCSGRALRALPIQLHGLSFAQAHHPSPIVEGRLELHSPLDAGKPGPLVSSTRH
jgi:DMSO/TMAO reductase YedYZ molybdopterin-dependent catalytic subunit